MTQEIPTLAEVFATVPDQKRIYIEIKCGVEIIPELREEIGKSGLKTGQIVVICFNKKVLQEFKTKAPQYRTFWLCSFKKDRSGGISPPLETVLEVLNEIKADGLSSDIGIPEPFIEAIGKQGHEWHVWTVDDLKTAKRMKSLGARSITSNAPGYLGRNLCGPSPADDIPGTATED